MQPLQIGEMARLHQDELHHEAEQERLARGDRFAEGGRVDGGRSNARLVALVAGLAFILIGAGAILADIDLSAIVDIASRAGRHA